MSNPLIRIEDLTVRYDCYTALENVSLTIYDDDFLGIIGPNGGGKTTLVKAVLGTIPHTGSVTFSSELSGNGMRRIGYLPQQSAFDRSFPISISEIVLSGLQGRKRFSKSYDRHDRRKAAELLERTGIADVASRTVGEVSGGQLQRALLCRALIADPALLILDEPANFVDNRFENELYRILEDLNRRMAIVMVSHDVGTITSVVKSIVCVNRHVHRHDSNVITAEQLENYACPIQLVSHGPVPHTVLAAHRHD